MNDAQIQVGGAAPAASTIRNVSINRRSHPFSRSRIPNTRPRRNPGFVLFQRQRKHFVTRVYLLSTGFILLTMIQWFSIVSNPVFVEFFKNRYYISLLAGLTALLFLTYFALFLEIRYIEPYNWIFAYLIVELETLALLRAALDSDLDQLGACLLATIGINATFIFIGIKFPRDLTQDIVIILVISLMFYVVASIILILLIATDTEMYYLKFFLIIGTLFLLLIYIIYVSQLLMGDRAGSLRWNDFILAALMVYFNFMLIFSSVMHLSNEFFY